jgi:hypothetical protein
VRIECAVLCDAATLRDDLLHILGAGVSGTDAADFPLHLPMTFAFRAILDSREQRPRHTLRLRLTDFTGRPLAEIEVFFHLLEGQQLGEEETALAIPIPLSSFELKGPGRYLIEASLDQTTVGTFPLRVRKKTDSAE